MVSSSFCVFLPVTCGEVRSVFKFINPTEEHIQEHTLCKYSIDIVNWLCFASHFIVLERKKERTLYLERDGPAAPHPHSTRYISLEIYSFNMHMSLLHLTKRLVIRSKTVQLLHHWQSITFPCQLTEQKTCGSVSLRNS